MHVSELCLGLCSMLKVTSQVFYLPNIFVADCDLLLWLCVRQN